MNAKTVAQRKEEYSHRIHSYAVEGLHPDDVDGRVKHRLCQMSAALLDTSIDELIVSGALDYARQFAEWGERLMLIAIDKGEIPPDWGKYSLNMLQWHNYEYLYGLSWMRTGISDDSLLVKALDFADASMSELDCLGRRECREDMVLGCAKLAARAGCFSRAMKTLVKSVPCRRVYRIGDLEVIHDEREFTRMLIRFLASTQPNDEMREHVVTCLRRFLRDFTLVDRQGKWSTYFGTFIAYIAAKYVDEFRPNEFTRPNVMNLLRFSPDDER